MAFPMTAITFAACPDTRMRPLRWTCWPFSITCSISWHPRRSSPWCVLAGRYLGGHRTGVSRWWVQWAATFGAGVLVLVVGLVAFGRDGMMATYAALVAVCGTVQWLAMRGWRR